ncbi:low molecular weight protein tyrosine phosphatase family protein [Methylopila turkensis]|uniref:Protein-tyrosine-phosphatase n=1 Tax=Methylopila turkensis TaxID=1437816 RepID=A0A9W6N806_9HYPH|nr:low molecular weight protein tyrosine phosphatase family protein [Methylopila turkensis]GLK80980.1 protein-tyrosine-phosphatase [Methylopila turkensis]
MKRVLFVCSRNRLRSPTAERVFGERRDLEVASAGLAPDAEEPVTAELLDWVEIVFVMEKAHRARLARRFRPHLRRARVICLDIPDDYGFMDPRLIDLLNAPPESVS